MATLDFEEKNVDNCVFMCTEIKIATQSHTQSKNVQ